MRPGLVFLAAVAAGAVAYFAWRFYQSGGSEVQASGGGTDLQLDIAKWCAVYNVDPDAMRAILGAGEKSVLGSDGTWPVGDDGSSFGPFQVHKSGINGSSAGAVDAYDAAHGTTTDVTTLSASSGDGASLAVRIAVWNFAQCVSAAGGINANAFTRYNGGGGDGSSSDYGDACWTYYQNLKGQTASDSPVASADGSEDDSGSSDGGDVA